MYVYADMEYISIRPLIWEKLRREGPRRHVDMSVSVEKREFDRVCEAFDQAEDGPFSDEARTGDMDVDVDGVKLYRAEYNVWCYYFGEDGEFPGGRDLGLGFRGDRDQDQMAPLMMESTKQEIHTSLDINGDADINITPYPSSQTAASDLSTPSIFEFTPDLANPTTPLTAPQMRLHLLSKWASRPAWSGYTPQLGFDPSTGEPWFSVRCCAANAYPALSGSHHRYLRTLQKQIPEFDVRYERFEGWVLVWGEFRDVRDVVSALDEEEKGVWQRFLKLGGFLKWWAESGEGKREGEGNENGCVEPIFKAYREWLELAEEDGRGVDIPEGFVVEECRGFQAGMRMCDREKRRKRGELVVEEDEEEELEMVVFPRKLEWHKRKGEERKGEERKVRKREEKASRAEREREKEDGVDRGREREVVLEERRYPELNRQRFHEKPEPFQESDSLPFRDEGFPCEGRNTYTYTPTPTHQPEHSQIHDRRASREDTRRGASPPRGAGFYVERGVNPHTIDRYRPLPRDRAGQVQDHDQRYRPRRSRSRERDRGRGRCSEGIDRYRSRGRNRKRDVGEIDRYRPRY